MIYFNTYRNKYGIMIESGGFTFILPNSTLIKYLKTEEQRNLINNCSQMMFSSISTKESEINEYDTFLERLRFITARILYHFNLSLVTLDFTPIKFTELIQTLKTKNLPGIQEDIKNFEERYLHLFDEYILDTKDNILDGDIFHVISTFNFLK